MKPSDTSKQVANEKAKNQPHQPAHASIQSPRMKQMVSQQTATNSKTTQPIHSFIHQQWHLSIKQ